MNQRQRYVAELLLTPSLEIRPIVLRIMMMVAELHHLFIARMAFVPHRPAVCTEPILIVLTKLNEAASRRIDQFDFHLQAGHSVSVPFGNVLLTAARGLLHLVFCTVSDTELVLLKPIGHIVEHLGLLIEDEVSIIAAAIQKSAFIELCHSRSNY